MFWWRHKIEVISNSLNYKNDNRLNEMVEWCANSLKKRSWKYKPLRNDFTMPRPTYIHLFKFKNKEDIVQFKLTWLY